MTTGFIAELCKSPDLFAFDDGEVTSRYLNQCTGHGTHDESEEERVAFFATTAKVGHEGGTMDAWGERVDKVEEELDDLKDHFTGGNIFEAVRTVIVVERREIGRRRRLIRLEWELNGAWRAGPRGGRVVGICRGRCG